MEGRGQRMTDPHEAAPDEDPEEHIGDEVPDPQEWPLDREREDSWPGY